MTLRPTAVAFGSPAVGMRACVCPGMGNVASPDGLEVSESSGNLLHPEGPEGTLIQSLLAVSWAKWMPEGWDGAAKPRRPGRLAGDSGVRLDCWLFSACLVEHWTMIHSRAIFM